MNDLNNPDDLSAAPLHTLAIDGNGRVWKKVGDNAWQTIGDDQTYTDRAIRLSARSLF